jgi:[acyl-carrier-protein] S-malonyltransferase
MGQDVFQASPAARAAYEQADEALASKLSSLCFRGPMDQLTLTANTQPAILATSAALLAALRERYPDLPAPSCAAGHSLGEYSALHAAGVMSLADAVRTCRVRGQAMQEAVPEGKGAMAAVMSLRGEQVEELCQRASSASERVGCANFNAPTQTVIAGHIEAVSRARELAAAAGGKAIALAVSAPFHCGLMTPARAPLRRALEAAALGRPEFPVLANVDAEPKPTPEEVLEALVEQVDHPVQWVRTIERLRALGVTHALEIGPGRVLAGLARRIDGALRVLSVGGLEAIDKVAPFLEGGQGG